MFRIEFNKKMSLIALYYECSVGIHDVYRFKKHGAIHPRQ